MANIIATSNNRSRSPKSAAESIARNGPADSIARNGPADSIARNGQANNGQQTAEDLREMRMSKVLKYVGKMRDLEATIPSVETDLTHKMSAMPADVRDYFISYSCCCQEITDKMAELADAQADLQRVSEQHRDGSDHRYCMQYLGMNTNTDDSELLAINKLVADIKTDLAALKRRRRELKPLIDYAEVAVYTELQTRLNFLKADLETKKRRANIMIKMIYQ